jgi:putative NADH-flavin reductase
MKFLVVGATGGIGSEIVKQSLPLGHHVAALVRSPEKMKVQTGDNLNLKITKGNPLDVDDLRKALEGQDVVFSALGPTGFGPTTLFSDFARSLVNASSGMSLRVVVVSAAILFKDGGFFPTLLGNTLLKNIRHGLANMEDILAASELDWSVVRPPQLTNGSATYNYQSQIDHLPKGKMTMSRADVADFMIKEGQRSGDGRRIIGLSG